MDEKYFEKQMVRLIDSFVWDNKIEMLKQIYLDGADAMKTEIETKVRNIKVHIINLYTDDETECVIAKDDLDEAIKSCEVDKK